MVLEGITTGCKASANMQRNKCNDKRCKSASLHHFSLLIVPPLYHYKAAPLISLPFTLLLGRACKHTHTSTHNKDTRTLCLLLPPQLVLQHKHFAHSRTNQRSVTRGRTVPPLYCTHPSLCAAPPLFLPQRRGRSVSQSVSQPAAQSKEELQSWEWLAL